MKELANWKIYRIIHVKNLSIILEKGMFSPEACPEEIDYYKIGNKRLSSERGDVIVSCGPQGNLGHYVPFYFGPLSPMLYQISTGYMGVEQVAQSNIFYLVSNLQRVIDCNSGYVFTDGHAKDAFSSFFDSIEELNHVDHEMAQQRYWTNNESDNSRKRRKQAEFLIYEHAPVELIEEIGVLNSAIQEKVEEYLEKRFPNLGIAVRERREWYY